MSGVQFSFEADGERWVISRDDEGFATCRGLPITSGPAGERVSFDRMVQENLRLRSVHVVAEPDEPAG